MNLEKYPMKPNGMYVLKKSDFDDIAEMILKEYMPDVLYRPQAVDIEYLAEECFYLDIKYDCIQPDGKVLGMIAFADTKYPTYDYDGNDRCIELEEGTLLVDMSLIGSKNHTRRRFTLAHEIAHWACQRSYHSPQNQLYDFRRQPGLVACRTENIEQYRMRSTYGKHSDEFWLEWQADRLGAALLMPKKTFKEVCASVFWSHGIRNGYLSKDVGQRVAHEIISTVAGMFDVSFRAAQIRMINLDLIKV